MSGAQRDFLLAGLWKEQEIPRWRCERKTAFPEELAGAGAGADMKSGIPRCARACGEWAWAPGMEVDSWPLQRRVVLGVLCPEAACCRKWLSWVRFLKQDMNVLNQRHAD